MSERLRCFIIMPYSEAYDEIYREAILPALKNLEGYHVLPLRADDMGPIAITLKANVENAVRSADFCIADISGTNLNVMYEVGYALGVNKPVIFIADKESRNFLTDISGTIRLEYNRPNLTSFRQMLKDTCLHIIRQIETQRPTNQEIQKLAGLSISLWERPDTLDRLMKSVRSSFSALVESPKSLINLLVPKIKEISEPNLLVRLVCANPEGEFILTRARELGVNVINYRAEMRRSLQQLMNELERIEGYNYELRLTDNTIYNSIFLSNDIGFFMPHFAVSGASSSISIQVERTDNPQMFSLLQQQFGQIWETSAPSHPRGVRNLMEPIMTNIMEVYNVDEKTAKEIWNKMTDTLEKYKNIKKSSKENY
ncbi:MAG TPA: hypothetical protein VK892_15630 [Pyrinomonadaceae bacterium]|nr:hypothetical protein [Pyrinomonadaceae bacterium]